MKRILKLILRIVVILTFNHFYLYIRNYASLNTDKFWVIPSLWVLFICDCIFVEYAIRKFREIN